MLFGEKALKNNHYYYYYYLSGSVLEPYIYSALSWNLTITGNYPGILHLLGSDLEPYIYWASSCNFTLTGNYHGIIHLLSCLAILYLLGSLLESYICWALSWNLTWLTALEYSITISTVSKIKHYRHAYILSMIHKCRLTTASVEHHGVQPTSCMDNEPEPSRGILC